MKLNFDKLSYVSVHEKQFRARIYLRSWTKGKEAKPTLKT